MFAQPVALLRPRLGDYERALVSYHAADIRACLSELHAREDDPSRLLMARALLRANQPADALKALAEVSGASPLGFAERETLRVAIKGRLGDPQEMARAIGAARAYTIGSPSVAQAAEFEYFVGVAGLALSDFELFEESAYAILEMQPVAEDPYVIPLAHTRARAYEALQMLDVRTGRFNPKHGLAALAELDHAPQNDAWISATSLTHVTSFACDLDLRHLVDDMTTRYHAMTWTDLTRHRRQRIALALAWCAALRGEEVAAFRWFRDASSAAESAIDKLEIAVDRGRLGFELHHDAAANEELQFASDLARTIDWAPLGERRSVLVLLAAAIAPVAPSDARWALEQYRTLHGSALSLGAADPRMATEIAFAEGRLAKREGRDAAAIAHFQEAHRIAETIGFRWRAQGAAIELAELQAGEHFATFARLEAMQRPASWLGRRTAALPIAA